MRSLPRRSVSERRFDLRVHAVPVSSAVDRGTSLRESAWHRRGRRSAHLRRLRQRRCLGTATCSGSIDRGFRPSSPGFPPDAFTAEGQFWGNPIYDWKRSAESATPGGSIASGPRSGKSTCSVDHFRAFAASWVVPADAPPRRPDTGSRVQGASFSTMERALGELSFIVEDLGLITPDVVALREELGFQACGCCSSRSTADPQCLSSPQLRPRFGGLHGDP